MRIEVTQHDIDTGVRGTSLFCPIANAIRRALRAKRVSSGYLTVSVFPFEGDGKNYPLPQEATDFAMAFDEGHKVEPMNFDMEFNHE